MDLTKLLLSGVFCFTFIIIGLYSAHKELMYYWQRRSSPLEHLTSIWKVRRRLLTSLILIGIMFYIFIGVNFIKFTDPKSFLFYWGICSLMVFFLFLLPLIDMRETVSMAKKSREMIYEEITKELEKNKYNSSNEKCTE